MAGYTRPVFLLICAISLAMILLSFLGFNQRVITKYSFQESYEKLADEENEDMRVRRRTECIEKGYDFKAEQRGEFIVLYNYIRAERTFSCHESVTYSSQGDYTFLDNIPMLAKRWMGPISIALYAPGDDFQTTLESIAYLRNCDTPLIREHVTFHIFFIDSHFPKPKYTTPIVDAYEDIYDCAKTPPFKGTTIKDLYRRKHNLTYPINVGRNVAREMAPTHYVFASDIELYPSVNFIQKFMKMINDHPEYERRKNPRVYVLPVFEVKENASVPDNKTHLQNMLKKKEAFLFHKTLCPACHKVPKFDQWVNASDSGQLKVFTIGKRLHGNKVWEAFYVGTHFDPLFDERLSWEGQGNKMTQAYSMCLLNYDYMVLDNAFVTHKPGIKKTKEQFKFPNEIAKNDKLLRHVMKPALDKLYGYREGCYL